MNSRGSHKCVAILACLGIVILGGILAVVWIQFYQGSFRGTTQYKGGKFNGGNRINYTVSAQIGGTSLKPRLKEYRENSYFESLGLENDIEYVKPKKISPLPLHDHDIIFNEMNNFSDEPNLVHHSGHFRHNMAEVWDPHPRYEIEAFGKVLKLQLAHDNKFIEPNIYVSQTWENYTHRKQADPRILGCFYTGNVQGDTGSDVVVSLCNGMTGFIRTSEDTYYIEPVEFINGTLNSFLHRIKKVPHHSKKDNEVLPAESPHKCGTNVTSESNNNEIPEEYPIALDLQSPLHNLLKRNTATRKNSTKPIWIPVHVRKKRDIENNYYGEGDEENEDNRGSENFIKVLVVADKSMIEFYKTREELDHYILTLMSQTSRLFKDPSIGNAISVSVAEIRILQNRHFEVTSGSQETLNEYCKWTEKYVSHTSHDVALLLTRDQFCKDSAQDCATVGVAHVGAMCTSRSCAIAIDRGLPTAYTIAHEIGHTLSIPHDNDQEKCPSWNTTNQKYIMTSSLEKDIKPWMWSPCSKDHVTEFLGSAKSKCLRKHPITNFISREFSSIPPGKTYELDRQCEFEFGEGSTHCPYKTEDNQMPCQNLWCTKNPNSGCSTNYMPWAEGTNCGDERWCHYGKCISSKEDDLLPIAGGWGPWSEWGPCSRTCGGGITISQRFCNNPPPKNAGDYCSGISVRYDSCNTDSCPNNEDFRAVQCAAFNGNNLNLSNVPKNVKWLPKYGLGKEDQCKLYCRPQHSNAYYLLPTTKVEDGTKCGFNSFGICVNGKCRQGGCDNKLRSKMELDECGICGGDNSHCEEISGSYNITATSTGYNTILKFPRGSSSLDIRQKDQMNEKSKKNYLALVDGDAGTYILNGNNVVTEQQKDIVFGGSIIKYSGSDAMIERITTAKNEILTKPLVLKILTIDSRSPPPDVTYRYIISKENAPSYLSYASRVRKLKKPKDKMPRYSWRLYQKEWSACTSICSGFQFMRPVCIELGSQEQVVDDYYCANKDTHLVQKKECNTDCRLIWNPVKRGECSSKCGVGKRKVTYNCMKIDNDRENYAFLQIITADNYGDVVDDKYCSILPKPEDTENCHSNCDIRWKYSDWSVCSKTCGGGIQTRSAKCVDNRSGSLVNDEECDEQEKVTERFCKNDECPEWYATEWSECSASCGSGYMKRAVLCKMGKKYQKEYNCNPNNKPKEKKECTLRPCVHWVSGEWSMCSNTCGNGVQTREVFCESDNDFRVVDLQHCVDTLKPNSTRTCHLERCPVRNPQPIFDRRYSYPIENYNNSVQIEFKKVDEKWITGAWTECSKSCGGGQSYRKVVCRGDNTGFSCDITKRPVGSTSCNTFKCPEWKIGNWTKCDDDCKKHRLVFCRNYLDNVVSESECGYKEKPVEYVNCKFSQCTTQVANTIPRTYFDSRENNPGKYKWKVGKWKACSSFCGKGKRYRNVTCEDILNDVILVDQFCKDQIKPKMEKPCERYNCAYAWIESNWSPCSAKCGNGIRTRNVTCHKVHPGGLIDSNPLPDLRYNRIPRNYCDMYRKPPDAEPCKESNCGDRYVWRKGPWKMCSHKCGRRGRQIRQLYCVRARTGEKVGKRFCPRKFKPVRKRKCNQWRCAYKSCSDVKNNLLTTENKDYPLEIRGRRAIIYCYKMDTKTPAEYISLVSDSQNYAEMYHKRLNNIDSCPYNGRRNDSCDCMDVGPRRSGLTRFYKIRLDISTMRIIADDYTFTRQEDGIKVPYGTAGDCYSKLEHCGQGRFSINLSETSFKLTNDVNWIGAITRIHKTDQTASGICGGYCGECMPDENIGLKVELR